MPVLEQVLEKYPEKVKIAFKNFPLRMHKFAPQAAMAALSAGKQGKFWEFHDLLYANYNKLDNEKIISIAQDMKLNMDDFNASLSDPALLAILNRDFREGVTAGVRGTPTIYVNGKILSDRSLQGFSKAIDRELGKKQSTVPSPQSTGKNSQ